jgi:ribonuclease P protein component
MMVERLKRRADFLLVAGSRRKYVTPGFVLQVRPRDAAAARVPPDAVRVGFTATRKLGSAVVRNRARRRLREAARETLPKAAAPGHDYVLIARPGALDRPYATLLADLTAALGALSQTQGRPRETAR